MNTMITADNIKTQQRAINIVDILWEKLYIHAIQLTVAGSASL